MKILFLLFLTVTIFGKTPLGTLSDSLKPGEWGVLTTNNYPDFSILSDNFAYANSGCWAEDSGFALFVGSVHAGHNHRLLTYVDSTNDWRYGPKLDGNIFPYTFGTHAYDNNAYDPTRGIFWYSPKGNDMSVACGSDYTCASNQFRRRLIRYDIKTNSWDSGILMPDTFPALANTTALKYFPEMDGLIYIHAMGSALAAQVYFYSFKTSSWRILGQGMPMGGLHYVCQYSKKHKVVIFGGGEKYSNIPYRYMYKIDSTGEIDTIASIPEEIKGGIMCSSGFWAAKFAEDPFTGDMLCLSGDSSFWSYNLPTNYWQKLPNAPTLRVSGNVAAGIVVPVPRYNVMMYIWSNYAITPNVRVYVYKHAHPHKDTAVPEAIHTSAPSLTSERYLSIPLTVSVRFTDGITDTITQFAQYRSLDTNIATVSTSAIVQGIGTGTAKIAVSFQNRHGLLRDTITLTFTPSLATIDSIRFNTDSSIFYMNKKHFTISQDSSYLLKGTVYGHSGSTYFSHPLDSTLTWTSRDSSIAAVSYGFITGKLNGTVTIIAAQGGKSDSIQFTVLPKLKFIKRINFQSPSLAAPYGWYKQGYSDAWNVTRGYGWNNGSPSDNNRVISGSNFLLQTRMISYSGTNFRIDLPPGEYIIKAGMGNIVPSSGAANWLTYGRDTLMKWTDKTGENGIQVDTINVIDNYITLRFMGYLCYLVVISKEGTDINIAADDGGLVDNIPGGITSSKESLEQSEEFSLSASPNPANPSMSIVISLPYSSKTNSSMEILTASGQLINSWSFSNTFRKHKITWNGNSSSGTPVSSGIYLLRLRSGERSMIQRIAVIQ
jgi:hypothetical protein